MAHRANTTKRANAPAAADPTSVELLEITSLTLRGAPLLLRDQRECFSSFKVRVITGRCNCEYRGPVRLRRSVSGSVRPGQARLGSVRPRCSCPRRLQAVGRRLRTFLHQPSAQRTLPLCPCLFIISCPCDTLKPLSMET